MYFPNFVFLFVWRTTYFMNDMSKTIVTQEILASLLVISSEPKTVNLHRLIQGESKFS